MLVSHVCRFIYLKTIKTAGTSAEIYFEPFCVDPKAWQGALHGRGELVSDFGIVGARGSEARSASGGVTWYNHMTASEAVARLSPEIWNSYYRFCLVRDPWDKVVSQFWYHLSPSRRAALSRGEFSIVRQALSNWLETGRLPLDRHIYTLNDKLAVDDTIRYENLVPDMERLCRRLGIPWQPRRLGMYKSGYRLRQELARDYFDDAAGAQIRTAFAWEFENLGYSAT
ncbi:MAG: hypothetical protein JWN34_4587 [Bryobacterales bacterium]|nr:hypothetical protein [Bryobacterales bacterium]